MVAARVLYVASSSSAWVIEVVARVIWLVSMVSYVVFYGVSGWLLG